MANPMQQFEVKTIGPKIVFGNFDVSFTNSSLFMVITVATISILFTLATQKKSLVPSRIQFLSEMTYEFVAKMISETAGSKARPFFSFCSNTFFIYFILQYDWHDTLFFYRYEPYHCNVCISSICIYWSYNRRLCKAWLRFFKTFCTLGGSSNITSSHNYY